MFALPNNTPPSLLSIYRKPSPHLNTGKVLINCHFTFIDFLHSFTLLLKGKFDFTLNQVAAPPAFWNKLSFCSKVPLHSNIYWRNKRNSKICPQDSMVQPIGCWGRGCLPVEWQPVDPFAQDNPRGHKQLGEELSLDSLVLMLLELDSGRGQQLDRVLSVHVFPARRSANKNWGLTAKHNRLPKQHCGAVFFRSLIMSFDFMHEHFRLVLNSHQTLIHPLNYNAKFSSKNQLRNISRK